MRPLLFMFTTLLLAGMVQFVIAEELNENDSRFSEIRDNTVIPYYEALKKGEVESLHIYLSAKRYAVNRTLIEQNELYPDHLRNHFREAMFDLTQIKQDGDKFTVLVKIYWPDGRNTHAILSLIEEGTFTSPDNNLRWKIDRD